MFALVVHHVAGKKQFFSDVDETYEKTLGIRFVVEIVIVD